MCSKNEKTGITLPVPRIMAEERVKLANVAITDALSEVNRYTGQIKNIEEEIKKIEEEIDKIVERSDFTEDEPHYKLWQWRLTRANERLTKEKQNLKEANERLKAREYHLQLIQPARAEHKRVRVEEIWFPETMQKKKQKINEDEDEVKDREMRYFEMSAFPPMDHKAVNQYRILERKSYIVIVNGLMNNMKSRLKKGGGNIIVTGNPGIGKSRLYLYLAFLLIREPNMIKELTPFKLVLNFGSTYHEYCYETKTFHVMGEDDVGRSMEDPSVIRLIEGNSSLLTGWSGVSILFASPGVAGLNDFTKLYPMAYVLPVWSFEELQEYNSILDQLRLPDDILLGRFDKYGGIPRFIFEKDDRFHNEELNKAIASFNAMKIINLVKEKGSVRENNYSHRILQMVPDEEDLEVNFHLDFLSKYIAEKVVDAVESQSFQAVCEFAISHSIDDSGSTAVLCGRMYEMLCHKQFQLSNRAS